MDKLSSRKWERMKAKQARKGERFQVFLDQLKKQELEGEGTICFPEPKNDRGGMR